MNCVGVVDVYGRTIVPMEYASVSKLSDRYIEAIKVTDVTEKKAEAVLYITSSWFSFGPSEGDTLLKGEWCVYDVTTGKPVENVGGTTSSGGVRAYEDGCIQYTADNGVSYSVDAQGEKLPENARIFTNGLYSCETVAGGSVCDADGNVLFSYASDGYIPYDGEDDLIKARKYEGGAYSYVVMDLNGNVISAEFSDSIYIYGDLIQSNNQVFNFQGQQVAQGEYTNVKLDAYTRNAWVLTSEDQYTVIKKDGTVLAEFPKDEISYFYQFAVELYQNSEYMTYSYKDQDYTIPGKSFSSWLAKEERANYTYALVNSIDGETLLSGYSTYNYIEIDGYLTYIYATNSGITDVYIMR